MYMHLTKNVLLIALLFTAMPLLAEDPPTLSSDQPEYNDVNDGGTATFTAADGSTDSPPDDRGCPPWTKTGNRKYFWHVSVVESSDEEGDIETSPGDGADSTDPTLTVPIEIPGKVEISVAIQEEWQDSSDDPTKLYWPESQ
ncbi:hypothetical protein BH09VER1_BH09VER1_26290 [soil metagenome]